MVTGDGDVMVARENGARPGLGPISAARDAVREVKTVGGVRSKSVGRLRVAHRIPLVLGLRDRSARGLEPSHSKRMNDVDRAALVRSEAGEPIPQPRLGVLLLYRAVGLAALVLALQIVGPWVLRSGASVIEDLELIHMFENPPKEELLEGWITEGDDLFRLIEHFRAEHDRLPIELAELASANGWDEGERRGGHWWSEGWAVADFGERGFALFLTVHLSSSVKCVLVRRSTGRYPADLEERATEVIERGPWRFLRCVWLSSEPGVFEHLVLRRSFHVQRRS